MLNVFNHNLWNKSGKITHYPKEIAGTLQIEWNCKSLNVMADWKSSKTSICETFTIKKTQRRFAYIKSLISTLHLILHYIELFVTFPSELPKIPFQFRSTKFFYLRLSCLMIQKQNHTDVLLCVSSSVYLCTERHVIKIFSRFIGEVKTSAMKTTVWKDTNLHIPVYLKPIKSLTA